VGAITLTSYSMLVTKPYTNPYNLTSVRVNGDRYLGSGTCSIGIMNCITMQCVLYTTYLNASGSSDIIELNYVCLMYVCACIIVYA